MIYYFAGPDMVRNSLDDTANDGEISISEDQYIEGLKALTSGKHISIEAGFEVIDEIATEQETEE